MRLLHTSDWHVGRSLHGTDLLAEQEAVLGGLAEVVAAERVDVVVVAGDVYDRAVPSADATGVLDRVLMRLRSAGAAVVLTPGNHDSARRLAFGAGLMARSGVHVRAVTRALDEPVLAAAMDLVRADLFRRPGVRSVVLAHAFVGGGVPSDSERDICVGGVDLVPAAVFDGIDYVALGHLHRPQTLSDRVRYSGSPLAYSFGEAGQQKQAWLVDLGADGLAAVRAVPLPAPRQLTVLRGELAELLVDPELTGVEEHFVSVQLTDPVRPVDPMRQLQGRFAHCVHLEWAGSGAVADGRSYTERLSGRSDLEVAGEFVTHVRGVAATAAERDLLGRALAAAAREDASL
jgi:exonuclease SbcD